MSLAVEGIHVPNQFYVVLITHFAKLEMTYIRHNVRTIIQTEMQSQLATMGLAQARPNYNRNSKKNDLPHYKSSLTSQLIISKHTHVHGVTQLSSYMLAVSTLANQKLCTVSG